MIKKLLFILSVILSGSVYFVPVFMILLQIGIFSIFYNRFDRGFAFWFFGIGFTTLSIVSFYLTAKTHKWFKR